MIYVIDRCRLRELLVQRGMTQTELATAMDVTPQQIQHYVQTNRVMSLTTAYNIAKILHCEIADLYEFKISGNKK